MKVGRGSLPQEKIYIPKLEDKMLTSSRCISNNENHKVEGKTLKGKLDEKELLLEDASSVIDNLVTKRDLDNLKEVISRLMDTRLSSLKTELERKIVNREVLEGRSSDSYLVERRTLDENESKNADIRTHIEFKNIKLPKDSPYTKFNNDLKEMLERANRQLKDQENSIDKLKKRCEKLERSNRNHGSDKKEPLHNKEESIRTELNSFKDSSKKLQVEVKKRLDQLECSIKLIQSTTLNHIRNIKTSLTKLKEDITPQMLMVANSLKTNTQEILLKFNNCPRVNLSRGQYLSNNHDTYQKPQDISHKSFYEEGTDFYQDNKELISIINLEESIAKSDAENFDEVRNMIPNNLIATNNRTIYEDDKAFLNFIQAPSMKEDVREYDGKFREIKS
jgi:hypothetical protein